MEIIPEVHDSHKFWKLILGFVVILFVLVIIDAALLYFKTTVSKTDTATTTPTTASIPNTSTDVTVKTYTSQQELQVLAQKTGQVSATTTDPKEFAKHQAELEQEMKFLEEMSKKK